MRKKITTLFFMTFPLSFFAVGHSACLKDLIFEKQCALQDAMTEDEKSQIYFELALAYFKDQENDKAFFNFLEALKGVKKRQAVELDPEENLLYKRALQDYFSKVGNDPHQTAKVLLEEFGEIAEKNPQFLHLNFLIATAYANMGKYDAFFERFYKGYPYLHDTFLAYKTQGILYLRLSHHGISDEERKGFQNEAFHYLTLALERNPQDPSLYKVLIFLAKDEKNEALILSYLQKIVAHRVELPRSDIYLYVKEAASLGAFTLAQAIIDQAKVLYDFSRGVAAAQEFLNQNRSCHATAGTW